MSKIPSQTAEVNSFLRGELAHLWPTITKARALQKACAKTLPQLFLYCHVLYLESEQLVVSVPNSALASKLKQQLPKLQAALQQEGWQVNSIRLKIQASQPPQNEPMTKQCQFSESALQAFSHLEKNLAPSKQNNALLSALRVLLARYK